MILIHSIRQAFWVLYFIGLAFLPRQYRQEGEGRLLKQDKAEESS